MYTSVNPNFITVYKSGVQGGLLLHGDVSMVISHQL